MFVHLRLENWRNFRRFDVPLRRRVFLVGPNASGKSNVLDALKFLRDVASSEGGFQAAVKARGGVSQLRSLYARQYSDVLLDVAIEAPAGVNWRYVLELNQDNVRRPFVQREEVWRNGENVLSRPDDADREDLSRKSQTHLQQVNSNKKFREVAEFFAQVRYMHVVPQLVREPERSVGRARDPYGGDFLEQLARLQKEQRRTFDSRLRRIVEALRVAVPQLKEMNLERDERGRPHLKGLYEHWRPNAGWQSEDQLSDGTLRLLGLLWSLLDGTAPLLLEEPELSLHAAVVRHIPSMIARLGRKTGRQVIISTHSAELLSEPGIAPEEVVLLAPSKEGTEAQLAASDEQIRALLEGGLSMAEAVIPRTAPRNADQLSLFGD